MFKRVCDQVGIVDGEITHSLIGNVDVAIYRASGRWFASTNICPHAQCLLHENGAVFDDVVECSCHGSSFSLATGENVNPPSAEPLQVFSVEVRDGQILIDIGD